MSSRIPAVGRRGKHSTIHALRLVPASTLPRECTDWYNPYGVYCGIHTPESGVSARGLAGPVTGQGGGGAALASALNLDLGIQYYFCGSVNEDCYGKIRLQPMTYIDDVNRSRPDLNSVRAGNIKFSSLAAEKQLKYHPKKSCYLVYGPDSFQSRIELEALEEPVLLGKDVIYEKEEEKYLGDILSSQGLSASVRATVKDRTGKVKGSLYELRVVMEDVRMQAVGGFKAALDLYESCIVTSLMANCSTWMEIDKKTEEELDALQDLFGRALFLSVLKLGRKLKRFRRYNHSKFFTKNPLMHHALIRRRVAPNICCNLLELSSSYF